MKFLSIVGNSFGCSASGERLVSAARDGDLQEAKALLDCNPRLVRYSTFGVRNSPLHYSAAQGHHEIVSLLLESGVDINLRNYRGQTALMQACQHGHWEVVQILILFKANIHRADYLNGGTALHLAALNGHSRCIRLLLADYIPSEPDFCKTLKKTLADRESVPEFDHNTLLQVINSPADGGVTALHMAALNGHVESVQLLLDLGASVSEVTVEDGTTIDLIGSGSTALHYAACGGNAQCCQILLARGASLTAENANGWTPLMVARSWHRNWLEEILSTQPETQSNMISSPFLSLPLMSIVKIARDTGWTNIDSAPTCQDPCVVCLERPCTVAAQGCEHEFCTRCALYLCSSTSAAAAGRGPHGSIACPLCRNGIVSFSLLPGAKPSSHNAPSRPSLSLAFCSCSASDSADTSLTAATAPFCRPEFCCSSFPLRTLTPSSSSSSLPLRLTSCQRFPSMKFNSGLCMGSASEISPSLMPRRLASCSRSGRFRRRSWFSAINHYVATGGGC